MPISKAKMALYPGGSTSSPQWQKIRAKVKKRSGNKCEGSPAFPKCRARNGKPHPVTGSIVVLTVAHRDHDLANNTMWNFRHWCQRCHNTHDARHRAENRRATKAAKDAERREVGGEQLGLPLLCEEA
jgi:5-methylcytosine-specific restriction endonuclease McrA